MATAEIRAITARFVRRVRALLAPRMIILYGSQAGSDARPSSDIDIAVVVDRIEGDFLDAQAALYRLRREIDDRIEPVLIEEGRDESGFLASIRACGEILFP